MQQKNTLKFIASLSIVAVFALVLASSGSKNGELKAPKLLPISASVANSARVVDILPVSDVVENSTISPIIVSTLTPTLQLTSQSGLYYVFYIHNVSGSTASSTPAFTSDYIRATGTKTSFTLPASQPNIRLSFGLVDGSTYAWTAKACADIAGSRCSEPASFSYFKVQLSSVTPITPDVATLPSIRAVLDDGSVLSFNGTSWVQVSGPSDTVPPTSDLPSIRAVLDDGSVLSFNGTEWVEISAGQTFFGGIGDTIGGVFDAIGDVAEDVVGWFVGLFTPDVATLPSIRAVLDDGSVLSFNGTSWVQVSGPSDTVPPTSDLPSIRAVLDDGSVSKFNDTTGTWEIVSPTASNIISSPCTDQFGFPGTLNPSGGCDSTSSSIISSPCTDQWGFPGTLNPTGGCDTTSSVRTTDQVDLYSSTADGQVYRFNTTTNKWEIVPSTTPTVESVAIPVVEPVPTGVRSIPLINSFLNLFN